jgi:hypothetical protein
MQVFHTFGVPPNNGKSNFAIIGCTENSKAALTNEVSANRTMTGLSDNLILFVYTRARRETAARRSSAHGTTTSKSDCLIISFLLLEGIKRSQSLSILYLTVSGPPTFCGLPRTLSSARAMQVKAELSSRHKSSTAWLSSRTNVT